MNKSQLLYELLWYVQNKKEFTAQELADHFNVSTRTIYRYISDLAEMGLYIESRQGKHGGFTLLDNQLLPPVLFLEDEIISLFFALQSLTNYQDFPFKFDTITAKEKLLAVMPTNVQERLSDLADVFEVMTVKQVVSTPYLTELITSALASQQIEIDYQSQQKRSQKQLEPIGVYGNNGFWYLVAWDLAIKDTRHYRVDRILDVKVSETTFTRKITLQESYQEYHPEQPLSLKVELSQLAVKRCLENRYLAKDVQLNDDGSGCLMSQIDRSDLSFTADFMMSLGDEACVKEPPELIGLLKKQAKAILNVYL